jgi:hypothetical protein
MAHIESQPLPAADPPRTFARIDRAQALLGFQPQTPLARGLAQFWEWIAVNMDAKNSTSELDSRCSRLTPSPDLGVIWVGGAFIFLCFGASMSVWHRSWPHHARNRRQIFVVALVFYRPFHYCLALAYASRACRHCTRSLPWQLLPALMNTFIYRGL